MLGRRRLRHLDVQPVGALKEHQIGPGGIRPFQVGLVTRRPQRVAEGVQRRHPEADVIGGAKPARHPRVVLGGLGDMDPDVVVENGVESALATFFVQFTPEYLEEPVPRRICIRREDMGVVDTGTRDLQAIRSVHPTGR